MTRDSDTRRSRRDLERQRAARRDTIPVALVAALGVAGLALSDVGDASDDVLWALPMVALAALLVRAELRDLRRADEYQRILLLEALAVGFVAVLALLFVGGLLAAAGVGQGTQWMQISFVGGVAAWGITKTVKMRQA